MSYNFEDFGKYVLDMKKMKLLLTENVFNEYQDCVLNMELPTKESIIFIADAIKTWALSNKCTHYAHWFHPFFQINAKKNVSFIERENNELIESFNYKVLLEDETDASSFLSGGLRDCFASRGFVHWDISSPPFIYNNVLYIPSYFCSINNEPLDDKLPLLKSIKLVNYEAKRLLHNLGYKEIKSVYPYLGLEQEFFLIDKKVFLKRKDLFLLDRTLFGNDVLKKQELRHHYYDSYPFKIESFFKELNEILWNLGIPIKNEHNEVAPSQFEITTLFDKVNVAIEQNLLMMKIMKKIALKHGLVCIFHEKPFFGVNGSGKHNNYSLIADNGLNVFAFDKIKNKRIFDFFTLALVKALDNYNDLFRLFSSNEGNDSRLGYNEAPPFIMTLNLSSDFENYFKKIKSKENFVFNEKTERNRTSAIAFIKDKLEFRTLGASMNVSEFNTLINTAFADSLNEFNSVIESLIRQKKFSDDALINIIAKTFKKHKRVLYANNCYSDVFLRIARERKLNNCKSHIKAICFLKDKKNRALFIKHKIFTEEELNIKLDVKYQNAYEVKILECKVLDDIVYKQMYPCLLKELRMTNHINMSLLPNAIVDKNEKIKNLIEKIFKYHDLILKKFMAIDLLKRYEDKAKYFDDYLCEIYLDLVALLNECEQNISKENLDYTRYDEILYAEDYDI